LKYTGKERKNILKNLNQFKEKALMNFLKNPVAVLKNKTPSTKSHHFKKVSVA